MKKVGFILWAAALFFLFGCVSSPADNQNQKNAVCGNGIQETGETWQNCCRDANCLSQFTCENNICVFQESEEEKPAEVESICGNGILEAGENDSTCCSDASCSEGFYCQTNQCVKLTPSPSDREISLAVEFPDPIYGKIGGYNCNVNERKNKFTIIIKKEGIYNNPETKSKIQTFLNSVNSDIGVENIGISFFSGDSIGELDDFIENLYYDYDVGYLTYIGGEFDFMQIVKGPREALDFDLSLVGKEFGMPQSFCREVIVSWILPPAQYSTSEKTNYISKILDTYTKYHLNSNQILSQFTPDYLDIQWKNGHPDWGADLLTIDLGYLENKVTVYNTEHDKVASELQKKHRLLYYNVHGAPTILGLGLDPDNDGDQYSYGVYTELEEFNSFIEENGTPALFVQPGSCGAMVSMGIEVPSSIKNCCWPQVMLDSGVWAYFGANGDNYAGQNQSKEIQKAISESPFIGYAIRHHPVQQYIIFGDLTSHFKLSNNDAP